MKNSLIKTIQQNLGYPPLQEIDANTDEPLVNDDAKTKNPLSQAAIPAILAALYQYSRADEAAETIAHGDLSADWLAFIFGDQKETVLVHIADYAGLSADDTIMMLTIIVKESITVIRKEIQPDGGMMAVKELLGESKDDILLYLPASLQIGKLLHDDTIDDSTHKMGGPFSILMHAIGGAFSGSDTDENSSVNNLNDHI